VPPFYAILKDYLGGYMDNEIKNPMPSGVDFELGIVKIGGDAVKVEEPKEDNEEKKA
jgi:hypothetical protein